LKKSPTHWDSDRRKSSECRVVCVPSNSAAPVPSVGEADPGARVRVPGVRAGECGQDVRVRQRRRAVRRVFCGITPTERKCPIYSLILTACLATGGDVPDSHLLTRGGCSGTQAAVQSGGCSGRVATYAGGCSGKAAPQANGCSGGAFLKARSRTRTVTHTRTGTVAVGPVAAIPAPAVAVPVVPVAPVAALPPPVPVATVPIPMNAANVTVRPLLAPVGGASFFVDRTRAVFRGAVRSAICPAGCPTCPR
jgi:hypothetical protein